MAQAPARVALASPQRLGEALGAAQRVAARKQAQQRGGPQVATAVDVAVLTRHQVGQLAAFQRHAPAFADGLQQSRAAFLMADMARQHVRGGGALAKVMAQAGEAHGQRRLQARGHVQHQHGVHARVHLGVVVGALGHAPQAVQLGQQHGQRAALAQHLEHARRPLFHEAARHLLPHTLGHEVVHLAIGHHLAHQRQRFGGNGEVAEARSKARHAQDAHRVFAERVGDVAQHARVQVAHAVIGVKNGSSARPVSASSYCIDSEIAPRQVLFKRNAGRRLHHEATVAAPTLALGACQRVFLVRAGV